MTAHIMHTFIYSLLRLRSFSSLRLARLCAQNDLRGKLSEATELRAQLAPAGLRIAELESQVAGHGSLQGSRS